MINQKALIVGASGLVGRNLIKNIKDIMDTHATYNTTRIDTEGVKLYHLDVRDALRVSELLRRIQPDIVINLAAKRNTRYCEAKPNEAYEVNVGGTENIASACKDINAKMVFTSSDQVFDGTKGNYNEDDEPNPLNAYGRQKVECEKIIKSKSDDWLIIRASHIYGLSSRKDNFIAWLLESFEKGHEVRISYDQFVTPINVENFVDILIKLLEKDKRGIYHVGEECLSKYEFAKRIKEIFQFDVTIKSVSSEALNQGVIRPKNNCMDLSKIKNEIDLSGYTIENGLKLLKGRYDDNC